MKLIGITGRAGSGKNTVGDWLRVNAGYEDYAMAQPLKAGLAAMGFPEPFDRDQKEILLNGFNFSWRDAAQKLGTEWGRHLDSNIWLKLAARKVLETPKLVITDIRFENEADMVRAHGGTVLHLVGRQVELGTLAGHASEQGLKAKADDYYIDNSGTLEQLYSKLREMINV